MITEASVSEPQDECGGGILADEMGLGKTLTMLCAIIRTIRIGESRVEKHTNMIDASSKHLLSRATLVVVPSYCKLISQRVSTSDEVLIEIVLIQEWRSEIEKYAFQSDHAFIA